MLDYSSDPPSRRAFLKLLGISAVGILIDACAPATPSPSTPTTPALTPTSTPRPVDETAKAYFQLWAKMDYAGMYQMLAPQSRAAISQDDFVNKFQTSMAEATVTAIQPQLYSFDVQGNTATIQYKIHYDTAVFDPIEEDNALSLVRDADRWAVVWSSTTIFKDLDPDARVKFYPAKSTRGNIYDRNGDGIAVGQEAILVSVWPAEMRRRGTEGQVIAGLQQVLNLTAFDVQRKYANANPEWKVEIATISRDVASANSGTLSLDGVVTEEEDARAYPAAAAAAHVAGYVGEITAEELGEVYREGYREGDMLGRSGLERAAERYVSGLRGGRLAILGSQGQEITTLKNKPAEQSQSVFSTIDLDLQKAVDQALGDKRGSIVVMDVRTGGILALASHPSYDPNA
ncbi:MAG: NTF2-like N-terminal transpeptidase domain-containing protein, partial [Rudaea sp.]